MIITKIASSTEENYLSEHYRHITLSMFKRKLTAGEYMVITDNKQVFGWLRWGYFWDEIPMINMLHIEVKYRTQGYGRQLVEAWEVDMLQRGYHMVMTSTLSDEPAQHFYRKIGYRDSGALLLPDEALEILLIKNLNMETEQ